MSGERTWADDAIEDAAKYGPNLRETIDQLRADLTAARTRVAELEEAVRAMMDEHVIGRMALEAARDTALRDVAMYRERYEAAAKRGDDLLTERNAAMDAQAALRERLGEARLHLRRMHGYVVSITDVFGEEMDEEERAEAEQDCHNVDTFLARLEAGPERDALAAKFKDLVEDVKAYAAQKAS